MAYVKDLKLVCFKFLELTSVEFIRVCGLEVKSKDIKQFEENS
jgi:hypothetical protein